MSVGFDTDLLTKQCVCVIGLLLTESRRVFNKAASLKVIFLFVSPWREQQKQLICVGEKWPLRRFRCRWSLLMK